MLQPLVLRLTLNLRLSGAVTPGETLGTLYNIHVGSNKTKQQAPPAAAPGLPVGRARRAGGRPTFYNGLKSKVGLAAAISYLPGT